MLVKADSWVKDRNRTSCIGARHVLQLRTPGRSAIHNQIMLIMSNCLLFFDRVREQIFVSSQEHLVFHEACAFRSTGL